MIDLLRLITKNGIQTILEQMNNSIFKTIEKGGKFHFGYFCNLIYQNKKIHAIIVHNILNNEEFDNSQIKILINNKEKSIELGEISFRDKLHNTIIIEIKENKNDNFNFIEIDDRLYEQEAEMLFNKDPIYIIQYYDIKNISVAFGQLKNFENNQLLYYGNLIPNYNCSLIFNLFNNKLIGIHNTNVNKYNKGLFFQNIVKEFIKRYTCKYKYKYKNNNSFSKEYNKIINEINIAIKVDKTDINKEIYFLDNYEYIGVDGKKHYHDNLNEFNELNTDLYINAKRYKYKKYFIPEKEGEYNIKLKFNISLTNSSYMFAGCKNIININFISFNTNYVTNMKYMFYECKILKTINLFSFDTQNVYDMSYMFSKCFKLNNLDFTFFNTKNVIDMSGMFATCKSLNDIDLSTFNTINVTNMKDIFKGCTNLNNLNLFSFDTKKVIYMSGMFAGCRNLNNLDLSSFNTQNVTDMSEMFFNCNNLNNIILSSFDTKNVTNMSKMFSWCKKLKNLNLSSFNTKNVTNIREMFSWCSNLINLDLSSFDTRNVRDMSAMFYICENLNNLNISSFRIKNNIKASGIFQSCPKRIIDSNISYFYEFNKKDLIFTIV